MNILILLRFKKEIHFKDFVNKIRKEIPDSLYEIWNQLIMLVFIVSKVNLQRNRKVQLFCLIFRLIVFVYQD